MFAPSEIEATAHETFFAVATICLVVRLVLSEVQEVARVVKNLRQPPGNAPSPPRKEGQG